MKIIFFLFSFLFLSELIAQDTLLPMIFLDDIEISEENNGFSVEEFIEYVKKDTTFYMGFKNLRYYTHNFSSELNIFNKNDIAIGILRKSGLHFSNGKQAWIELDSIFDSGKIFKRNGDYKFYTPEAFDEVFFPSDTINVDLVISKSDESVEESQNLRDAKTVGFTIGTADVEQKKGGMSKRLAVFDVDMQKYYDYTIGEIIYNEKECYTFSIKNKENLSDKDIKKALIRNIMSYFDKENFNVIYREYKFVYNSWLISLDMDIKVEMDYVNNKHVPIDISYRGFWDVMFFKPERASFKLLNSNFIVN
jgi:hypothetical protein|tara:strand:- start:142 stop:1062 length:921 start_codon:yes stop_codon:yes gene_type:complete